MLITRLKEKETIESLLGGTCFILNCRGCSEMSFPQDEADALEAQLASEGKVTGILTTDYICSPENLKLRLERHQTEIEEADAILVLSCGVGVQTVSELYENKKVFAGCDTLRLPGFLCFALEPEHVVDLVQLMHRIPKGGRRHGLGRLPGDERAQVLRLRDPALPCQFLQSAL